MSSIIYGTVAVAALLGQAAAFPSLYDSVHSGCEIPDQGYKGHGDPVPNPDLTMTVTLDGTPVTEFVPGEEYSIEVPAYSGVANCWLHASAGVVAPADATTHTQAGACMMASFSQAPQASHTFMWVAPDTSETVTISVAQATGGTDNYNTATMDLPGGAAAPGAAPAAAADDSDDEDEGTTTTATEGAEGTTATAPAPTSSGFAVVTGALAAAAAAVAALVM